MMRAVETTVKIAVVTAFAAALAVAASCTSVPAQITEPAAPKAQAAVQSDVSFTAQTAAKPAAAPKAAAPEADGSTVEGTVVFETMQRQDDGLTADEPDTADEAYEEEAAIENAPAVDMTDGVWLQYSVQALCYTAYRFADDGTYTAEEYGYSRDAYFPFNEQAEPVHNEHYDRSGTYTVDDEGNVIFDDFLRWDFDESQNTFLTTWEVSYNAEMPYPMFKTDQLYRHDALPLMGEARTEGAENRNYGISYVYD